MNPQRPLNTGNQVPDLRKDGQMRQTFDIGETEEF